MRSPTVRPRASLLVVLLAFLAVKLVNPGSSNHHKHSYQTLVSSELPKGEVSSVEFKNKGKALEVKLKNKETYEVGFIEQATRLLRFEAGFYRLHGRYAMALDRLEEAARLSREPGGESARVRMQRSTGTRPSSPRDTMPSSSSVFG